MKSTNLPTKKQKNELTLKSFLDECGAWVVGSWRSPSSSFHSRDGWYFFPLKVRKVGPQGDAMEVQRWKFVNGFQKNGFCKNGQELKDLRDGRNQDGKPREVIF